jgi:hypothetical protein
MAYNPKEPIGENDIIVQVPKGSKGYVRVEEAAAEAAAGAPQITVRVSNKRKYDTSTPVLGVIVK